MKAFVCQTPGYSMNRLENIWEATRVPSDFFDQPVRPAGVCFSGKEDLLPMAKEYASEIWGVGTLTYYVSKMSDSMWDAFTQSISLRAIDSWNVGFH